MLNVNFDPFPELRTERLLLRKITDADTEQIFKLRSDKDVMKYIGKKPIVSMEEAKDWVKLIKDSLENNSGITWGIVETFEKTSLDKTFNETFFQTSLPPIIGTIGLWRIIKENYRAEIGYMLLPEYWKKGFIKEAILKVAKYGFDEMKLHSIEAHISPKNVGSATVLERTGFVREGYFKEDFFFNGVFEDTAIYSLLA
jgi:ribosomal-protein-alanine N-acetyltransferase